MLQREPNNRLARRLFKKIILSHHRILRSKEANAVPPSQINGLQAPTKTLVQESEYKGQRICSSDVQRQKKGVSL